MRSLIPYPILLLLLYIQRGVKKISIGHISYSWVFRSVDDRFIFLALFNLFCSFYKGAVRADTARVKSFVDAKYFSSL